jgi:hypothetical protein
MSAWQIRSEGKCGGVIAVELTRILKRALSY